MKLLSTRACAELWRLQSAMRHAASERSTVLRMLLSNRNVITPSAQRELWLEFACMDQEYRYTVAQLVAFCAAHGSRACLVQRESATQT